MVDITGLVTFAEISTVGGIIGLLINVVIITAVIALADNLIAHEMSLVHSLVMALISFFAMPILLSYLNISFPFSGFLLPIVIWIVLGEVLLKGDRLTRLKVALLAFVINFVLTFVGIPSMLAGLF